MTSLRRTIALLQAADVACVQAREDAETQRMFGMAPDETHTLALRWAIGALFAQLRAHPEDAGRMEHDAARICEALDVVEDDR